MTRRKTDFDRFLNELDAEAAAADETETPEAYREHFRLARQVIRLRKERRWTQQQFARASGVPQSEISRIESGRANPTYRTLQMLAQAAKMNIAFVADKSRSPRRIAAERRRR